MSGRARHRGPALDALWLATLSMACDVGYAPTVDLDPNEHSRIEEVRASVRAFLTDLEVGDTLEGGARVSRIGDPKYGRLSVVVEQRDLEFELWIQKNGPSPGLRAAIVKGPWALYYSSITRDHTPVDHEMGRAALAGLAARISDEAPAPLGLEEPPPPSEPPSSGEPPPPNAAPPSREPPSPLR